jgi:hypothetical protein
MGRSRRAERVVPAVATGVAFLALALGAMAIGDLIWVLAPIGILGLTLHGFGTGSVTGGLRQGGRFALFVLSGVTIAAVASFGHLGLALGIAAVAVAVELLLDRRPLRGTSGPP